MKTTYTVTYDPSNAIATFEIDSELLTDELLNEINDFWGGNEERLEAADGGFALGAAGG